MTNDYSVPFIRSGAGRIPSEGGCVMQILSWIKDGSWIDSHSCVHPAIRNLAIRANDSMEDAERQKLIDLIPRMINTNIDDRIINVKLAIFSAEKVLHLYESKHPSDNRPRLAIEAAKNYVINPCVDTANAAANAAYAANAAANAADAENDSYKSLVDFLDYYDTLNPRKIVENDTIVLNDIACMIGAAN